MKKAILISLMLLASVAVANAQTIYTWLEQGGSEKSTSKFESIPNEYYMYVNVIVNGKLKYITIIAPWERTSWKNFIDSKNGVFDGDLTQYQAAPFREWDKLDQQTKVDQQQTKVDLPDTKTEIQWPVTSATRSWTELRFLQKAEEILSKIIRSMGFIVSVFFIFFIYFLPSIVGIGRKNSGAILILNLFLGWTFIGWVVALTWACCKDNESRKICNVEKLATERSLIALLATELH